MKFLPLIAVLTSTFCSLGLARADEPPVLQGQIVDVDGHPLAGVQVFAWQLTRALRTEVDVPPMASTVSDAQGKWKFPGINVTHQILTVGAWPQGYGFGGVQTGVLPGMTMGDQKIVVSPEKTVHLHLVTWKNQPVRGASASLVSQTKLGENNFGRPAWIWNLDIPGREKTVNAEPDGTLTLPFGGARDIVGVQVNAAGYQSTTVAMNVPQDDGLTVRLTPGAAVRGRLVDVAGHPIGGQKISQMFFGDSTVTQPDGTFSFSGLDETPTFLALSGNDLVLRPKAVHPSRETAADAGDFVAEPGALVSGRATDVKTGKPLDGYLTVQQKAVPGDREAPWQTATFTEGDGKFSVRVPSGRYSISFMPIDNLGRSETTREIEVATGQPATVDFAVNPDGKNETRQALPVPVPEGKAPEPQPQAPDYIFGSVTIKDGVPVAGAQVTVYQGNQAVRDARTGENGKYAIGPLRGDMSPGGGNVGGLVAGTRDRPAPKIYVRAEAPGLAPASVMVPLGSDGPVNLKLGVSQELRIRLLDSAGQPVPGAKVSIKKLIQYNYTPDGPREVPAAKGQQLPAAATTGADGIAVFQTLPSEGFCEVGLEHPDYAPFTNTVALPRLTTVDLPLRKPTRVEGSIHFGDETLKGANFQVRVRSTALHALSEASTPAGDGHFEVKNLPPNDQLTDDNLSLRIEPAGDKKEVAPGLKLEAVQPGENPNVYLTDTRDPNLTHRWIGYAARVPKLSEGGSAHVDITMIPMTRIIGKVPTTTANPNPTDLAITYSDPDIANSFDYSEPVSVNPDKDGKFEIWIPAGKTITLYVKPKKEIWGNSIMSAVVKDPVADEDREITFKADTSPDEGVMNTMRSFRVVGPDGATVPRVALSYRIGEDVAAAERTHTISNMDGSVQIFLRSDPKGETLELTSEYLDKPYTVKWDENNPSPRIVLSRIPDKIAEDKTRGRYFGNAEGVPAPTPAAVGDMAPEFKIEEWGRGGPVTMAGLRGKTVLVCGDLYGLQSVLPILEKRPGKVVVMLLLNPNSGEVTTALDRSLDSEFFRFGEDVRQRVGAAISVVGEDVKVANEWRGYTALALGVGYRSAIVDPQGRIAATGLWGTQMAAKVDQLSE